MTRVLVVDDKEKNLYYLEALLSADGWTVDTAHHGAEALAKASLAPPALVISDLLMPVMDGYTLLRHWKADERLKRVPFIVYTATYTAPEDERLALRMGADAFILKPAEPDDFLARIREVRAREASAPPATEVALAEAEERFQMYGETLIRKLEEKTIQLDHANQTLERELEQQREMENTLRVSEARSRATFERAAIGMADVSVEGRFLRVNDKLCEITGYSREELLERSTTDLTLPEDRAHGHRALGELLASNSAAHAIDVRIRRRDGTDIWADIAATVVQSSADEPLYYVAVFSDITQRKHAEAQLIESEQRFALALKAGRFGVWDYDVVADRLVWDQEMFRMYGVREQDFSGAVDAWQSGVHPDDRARAQAELAAALQGSRDFHTEFRVRWPTGEERDIEAHAVVQRNAAGAALRMTGVNRDVTERKQSDRRIAEQAALIDEASSAFIVRDLEHRVLFWSRGAEELFGWTMAEAVGQRLDLLLQPDGARFTKAFAAVLSDGHWAGELTKVTKAGLRVAVDVRWTLRRDALGQPMAVLGVDTDITERKKLEQQFLRAQRMESIGTLAGGVAHDLNNALLPIIMSIDLLKASLPDRDSQELLATIGSSAQHGAEMVRQLLSFARGVEGQRVEVQVRHLVREIEKIVRDTFLKSVAVRTDVEPGLWMVIGDPTQIHQVLMNLCVNARDAMPDGGNLVITAANVELDAQYAAANLDVVPGPYVRIQVEDSGMGIPASVLEKIFDPFFTTKEVGKGTGLGLSTTLAILKSHGGFIRVYSEPGRGSKFTLFLPAKAEAAGDAIPAKARLPRGRGELILVVDDEPSVCYVTKQTLEAFGYRVLIAHDGAEAVALYAARGPEIAAVLTDMMMPVMDGIATTRVLRKLNSAVRIIGASGLYDDGHAAQVASLGIAHFLPKPFLAEALLNALHECLGARHEPES